MLSCIVLCRKPFWLYKLIDMFVEFFSSLNKVHTTVLAFCHLHSSRGFVQPRPPAGIRDDNSGAFRQLLLHCNSHNITETVHFIQPSPLCSPVTQSICLPTFSCLDTRLASPLCLRTQFLPWTLKKLIYFLSLSLSGLLQINIFMLLLYMYVICS